jgi:hypothetical protein
MACPLLLLLILVLTALTAQDLTKADVKESLAKEFEQRASDKAMKCEFRPIQPSLNYALVQDAGYVLRFPRGEFAGDSHTIHVTLRMTFLSEARTPVYLSNVLALPAMAGPSQYVELSARFAIESGNYKIDSVATDEEGRVCRGQWGLEVSRRASSERVSANYAGSRVTIFLDATPTNLKTTMLHPSDIEMFAGTVLSLTRSLAGASVDLVVFDINSEAEFRRYGSFAQADVGRLIDGLKLLQFATTDYGKLKSHSGPAAFLTQLVGKEVGEQRRPDIVIFLGQVSHVREDLPKRGIFAAGHSLPAFYYLEYRPSQGLADWGSRPEASGPSSGSSSAYPLPVGIGPYITPPDTIERLMRRVAGRTIVFATPEEFGSGIGRIVPSRIH